MVRQVTVGLGIVTLLIVKAPAVGERDRRAQDARTTIRAVQMAQAQFFELAGHYESLQCLASATCVSQFGFSGPNGLISPEIAALTDRFDYRFLFYLGPRVTRPTRVPSMTPVVGYAMVAVPLAVTEKTPVAYCGDVSGTIFASAGDRLPPVREGLCLERNKPLY